MSELLKESVKDIIIAAQSAFNVSTGRTEIKKASSEIEALLNEWTAHDKIVRKTLGSLLDVIRSNCKHVGAKRGHNERDGSWMNRCPTCGKTE